MDHKKRSSIGLYSDPERFFVRIFKIIPEKPEKVSEVTPYYGSIWYLVPCYAESSHFYVTKMGDIWHLDICILKPASWFFIISTDSMETSKVNPKLMVFSVTLESKNFCELNRYIFVSVGDREIGISYLCIRTF